MKPTTHALPPQVLRSRLGRVCVAITGETVGEMLATAEGVLKENPFLEFRLDYLDDPHAALGKLRRFLGENSVVTAIATCRRRANGGRYDGDAAAQLAVLAQAAEAGCQLLDIEIETAEAAGKAALDHLREAAAVVLSFHDYKQTGNLDAVLERMRKFTPDFYKVVSTARTLADNVKMIRFLEASSDQSAVVGNLMGEAGIISRVLGVRAGSAFTFAAAHVGEETAPGQIAARTLREIYRIDQVDTGTQVFGVAGDPVKHSLSPLMMNTAFRRETVNAVYLALQTSSVEDLLALVNGMPLQGISVTMPLKQAIVPHLERTDAWSQKVGACNTVVRLPDGKLFGYNTDVTGILSPLEARLSLKGAKVLVLGAGGAARAAIFGVRERGAEVSILNRTTETAQKLAREARVKCVKREALAKSQWDVIINATPVGMAGYAEQSWLTPEEINARFVFDMVYDPTETPLIKAARRKGCGVITGVEMFVQQGADQFQIWTRKPAPREEMSRVVARALQQRAESAQATAAPAAPAVKKAKADKAAESAAGPGAVTGPVTVKSKKEPIQAFGMGEPQRLGMPERAVKAKAPVSSKKPEAVPVLSKAGDTKKSKPGETPDKK